MPGNARLADSALAVQDNNGFHGALRLYTNIQNREINYNLDSDILQ